MKYLKIRDSITLSLLYILDEYPKAVVVRDKGFYGEPEFISAHTDRFYAPNTTSLFFADADDLYSEEFDEFYDMDALYDVVKAEVDLWNSDPEKYWKAELTRLHLRRIENCSSVIEKAQQHIEESKRALEDLQEKDK